MTASSTAKRRRRVVAGVTLVPHGDGYRSANGEMRVSRQYISAPRYARDKRKSWEWCWWAMWSQGNRVVTIYGQERTLGKAVRAWAERRMGR